jgi:hypothetical protein
MWKPGAPSPLQCAGSDCLYPAGLRRLKPPASITQHQPGCGRYSGSIHRPGHVCWFERDCDGQRHVVDDSALDLPAHSLHCHSEQQWVGPVRSLRPGRDVYDLGGCPRGSECPSVEDDHDDQTGLGHGATDLPVALRLREWLA